MATVGGNSGADVVHLDGYVGREEDHFCGWTRGDGEPCNYCWLVWRLEELARQMMA